MVSIRKGGFSDGGFSKKVISLTQYDSAMLTDLHINPSNKQNIEKGAANLVYRYFEAYVDAKARSNPSALHHVYEFDKTGDSSSRLFKRDVQSTAAGAVVSYKFINARNPNREGYPFPQKAKVMEDGESISIQPRTKDYLTYKIDGRFIKSRVSVVDQPGGNVAGNFSKEIEQFNTVKAKVVLREFRYFEKINSAYRAKRRLIIPRINANTVGNAMAQAAEDARLISVQAEEITGG